MKKTAERKSALTVSELLLAAMGSEILAREFYSSAADKAQSNAGKKLFHELAEMEQRHYENVKKIIGTLDHGRKIEKQEPSRPVPKIKPEVSGEFEPNKDELVDILIRGIDAEKAAHERYKKIAAGLTDETGKNIFEGLAEDERRHQALLEAEYYQISNKGTMIWGD